MAFLDYLTQQGKLGQSAMKRMGGGGLSEFLTGKPEEFQQVQRFTPEQQGMMNQILGGLGPLLGQGMGFLGGILGQDPESMRQFEAPARRAFQEETVPSIAERFSGMGAQKSSAFNQALARAASGLEESLSAQRAGLGFQGLGALSPLMGAGLTPQFETMFRPETQGLLGSLGGGLGGGLGQALGMLPMLAML